MASNRNTGSCVAIVAGGSRGDVDPYVALGVALAARGHRVRVCSLPTYAEEVRRLGLEFAPIEYAPGPDQPAGLAASHRSPAAFLRALRRDTHSGAVARYASGLQACRDADLLVTSPLGLLMSASIAEALDVPLVRAFYSPASPTGDYPALLVPHVAALPRPVNRWTHAIVPRLLLAAFRPQIDRARREALGLGPIAANPIERLDARRMPVLHAYSPIVCPPSADFDSWVHVTGYWRALPRDWQPPAALARFLADGPPPVYVGFGSMVDTQPARLTDIVVAALAAAGLRGILATGWGGLLLSDAPHVHSLREVPHDWLFPRVVAAVHHGGAGTAGAAAIAGVPSVIVPFGMPDQRFWGRRMAALGVAAPPIARRRLTAAGLTKALRRATAGDMRAHAAALGRRLRTEDGLTRAADLVSGFLAAAKLADQESGPESSIG